MKSRLPLVAAAVLVTGLLLALVRENSHRMETEAKLSELQLKIESFQREKEGAIDDLEIQLSETETRLREGEAEFQAMAMQKNDEISKLNAQMEEEIGKREETIKKKSSEVDGLQAQMKKENEKWTALLEQRSTEIAELSNRLREVSADLDRTLEERRKFEAESLKAHSRVIELEGLVSRFKSDAAELQERNAKLLSVVQKQQAEAQPAD